MSTGNLKNDFFNSATMLLVVLGGQGILESAFAEDHSQTAPQEKTEVIDPQGVAALSRIIDLISWTRDGVSARLPSEVRRAPDLGGKIARDFLSALDELKRDPSADTANGQVAQITVYSTLRLLGFMGDIQTPLGAFLWEREREMVVRRGARRDDLLSFLSNPVNFLRVWLYPGALVRSLKITHDPVPIASVVGIVELGSRLARTLHRGGIRGRLFAQRFRRDFFKVLDSARDRFSEESRIEIAGREIPGFVLAFFSHDFAPEIRILDLRHLEKNWNALWARFFGKSGSLGSSVNSYDKLKFACAVEIGGLPTEEASEIFWKGFLSPL